MQTLELLAEVAVLEEEVVRLEEKVVHFRQGLYQEAVYISSSKKNMENSTGSGIPDHVQDLKSKQSKSLLQTEPKCEVDMGKSSPSLSGNTTNEANSTLA